MKYYKVINEDTIIILKEAYVIIRLVFNEILQYTYNSSTFVKFKIRTDIL